MDKQKARQHLIRVACLLASFVLWLYVYNFINPTKSVKRDINVEITNTEALSQEKLVLIPEEKYTVTLSLTGSTVAIDKISSSDFKLVADLNNYALKKGGINKIPVYIAKKPSSIQISNSDMLYINVRTDDYIEKTVPIKSEVKGKVKTGYYAYPTSFNPTTVLVTGAARYVNQVVSAMATINFEGLNLNTSSSVNLRAVDGSDSTVNNVTINPVKCDAVTVIKKVKSVGVNVQTKGTLGKDYTLKSITPTQDKVEIAFDENSANNSIASLDTAPLALDTISGNKDVQLSLVLPDGVKLINSNGLIDVKVVVSKSAQKNISQAIKINNLGNNLNATLDKTTASLVISGDESVISNLKDGDIDCSVDLNNLGEGTSYSLKVVTKLPPGITIVSQAPDTVKVAIIKKQ